MSVVFSSTFDRGECVVIDEDEALVGVVTSYQFRVGDGDDILSYVEVSYVHCGETKSAWVEEWRVSRARPRSSP